VTKHERQVRAFQQVIARCDEKKAEAVKALVLLTKKPHWVAGRKVHWHGSGTCIIVGHYRGRPWISNYPRSKNWDEVTCRICLKKRRRTT
jgi:hypothetical protein